MAITCNVLHGGARGQRESLALNPVWVKELDVWRSLFFLEALASVPVGFTSRTTLTITIDGTEYRLHTPEGTEQITDFPCHEVAWWPVPPSLIVKMGQGTDVGIDFATPELHRTCTERSLEVFRRFAEQPVSSW